MVHRLIVGQASSRCSGRYVAQLFSRHITRILDLGSGQEFTIPGAWEAAWSPDSRTLAFARYDGGNRQSLWLADAVTGETTELVPTDKLTFGGRIHNIAWSPDGRYLFVDDQSADSPIWRISAGGEETVTLLPGSTLLGVVPQWEALLPRPPFISPDGRWRVITEATDQVAAEEDELEQFSNGKYRVEMVAERTDGSQTWTAVAEWRPWGLGLTYPEPVRWSTDGRFLYFANVPVPDGCSTFVNGGDLWRLDLESGAVEEVAPYIGLVMALSPDETQLAVNASFGRGFFIRELSSGEEQPVELPQPANFWNLGGLQWSPDGRHLLVIQVVDPCSPDAKSAIVRVDLAGLSATTILEPDERNFTLLKWVDGDEVRLLDKDGYIWYLELFSGELAQSQRP